MALSLPHRHKHRHTDTDTQTETHRQRHTDTYTHVKLTRMIWDSYVLRFMNAVRSELTSTKSEKKIIINKTNNRHQQSKGCARVHARRATRAILALPALHRSSSSSPILLCCARTFEAPEAPAKMRARATAAARPKQIAVRPRTQHTCKRGSEGVSEGVCVCVNGCV